MLDIDMEALSEDTELPDLLLLLIDDDDRVRTAVRSDLKDADAFSSLCRRWRAAVLRLPRPIREISSAPDRSVDARVVRLRFASPFAT